MVRFRSSLRALALVALAAVSLSAPSARTSRPAIVFVSRHPLAEGASGIPGFGPLHRTAVTRGRLLVRRLDGKVRPLVQDGTFLDVSDPAVSWNGKRVAFAATPAANSPWRIYVIDADGTNLRALTRSDRVLDLAPLGAAGGRFATYDDFDPCWLPDGRVCFASTRYPQVAQLGDLPVSNLFLVGADGEHVTRITSERNGGEEPTVDGETGRIAFSRWWFNRYLASEVDPSGITTDPSSAVAADPVNLWQAVTVTPAGDNLRLAGGHPRVRAETMLYQPIVLANGTVIGVGAENTSLIPSGGPLTLRAYPGRFSEPRALAGGSGASACAPTVLPDGRILFSYDRTGQGDFGLFVVGPNGGAIDSLLDFSGTLELDAAVLAPRRPPPVIAEGFSEFPRTLPVTSQAELRDSVTTFRFDCLNVFANAGVDVPIPDAPPLLQGLRIRFYATLSRPAVQGGDTVLLLRETPVDKSGAVHEHELPADTPMFEQLIDAHGHVLRSTMGPAHVPGFNAGRFGSGTKCVGCHIGHSAIPVAPSAFEGKRFNATPSAEVSATSTAPGNAGPRALAERRTRGAPDQVAWIAETARDQAVKLAWKSPIEVDAIVIYALGPQVSQGTDLRVRECEVVFQLDGREVRRSSLKHEIVPGGTRLACGGVRVDAIEIRPTRFSGKVRHRAAVALAEVETLARLPED